MTESKGPSSAILVESDVQCLEYLLDAVDEGACFDAVMLNGNEHPYSVLHVVDDDCATHGVISSPRTGLRAGVAVGHPSIVAMTIEEMSCGEDQSLIVVAGLWSQIPDEQTERTPSRMTMVVVCSQGVDVDPGARRQAQQENRYR